MGLSQNVFEFLYPYEMKFDVQNILEELRSYNQSSREWVKQSGLDEFSATLQLVSDPLILDKIDQSGLLKPGIEKF